MSGAALNVQAAAQQGDAPWAEAVMDRIYARGDRLCCGFVLGHFVVALLLAPFYGTWFVTLSVGTAATVMFLASALLVPRTLFTRWMAGTALQTFVALHIYQLHGLPEMHFFFFTAFTMMIAYQDRRAMWPGAFLIIGQHLYFAILQNSGVELYFFSPPVGFWKLFFHFSIALLHVAVCSYWAHMLRRRTLRDAWQSQQLEEARSRAEQATLAKSAFLATMSHEIRTPMNGVLGMTSILLDTPLSVPQRQHVETIRTSGDALLTVINDILDFSKVEAGRMTVDRKPFDVERVVGDVTLLLAGAARAKDLTLTSRYEPTAPRWILGDPVRLRQILINLASNAIKYTDRGRVHVDVRAASGAGQTRLLFSVRDTGVGITAEGRAQLFQEFTQLDASSTRRHGGTGLGLAISRRLIDLLGGSIDVESEPGQGSTFIVTLPVETTAAGVESLPEIDTTVSQIGVPALRVLLAEDNAVNQQVAGLMLRKLGCSVDVVATGREAVGVARNGAYDVIFMDCHMPEMDGFEATAAIRQIGGAVSRTPIVALTASVLPEDRERAARSGMDDFLAKPVRIDELRLALNRVRPRHRRTA